MHESTRGSLTPFFAAGAATLFLDVATKIFVHLHLPMDGAVRPFIGDLVRWTHIHNAGAAFGLFQGNRFFFIAVSIVSAMVILYLVVMRRYRSVPILIGFGMILGGALGNLADRIWLGVVIDFIDIGIGELRWPVFNVADMGVTLGVLVLGIGLIREEAVAARREAPDDGVVEDREGDAASSYNA